MTDQPQAVRSLRVEVRDIKGNVVPDAAVALRPAQGGAQPVPLEFDPQVGLYVSSEIPAGDGELQVRHKQLQPQSRRVTVGAGTTRELFILGASGTRTYFREKVRVPVDAEPNLIAVTLEHGRRQDAEGVEKLARGMGLSPEDVPALAHRAGVRLFRAPGPDWEVALERLTAHPAVEHAGAVVSMRERGFSHLTREIVVRFRGPKGEQVRGIAREFGYTVVRELVYAPSTYVLRWDRPATLELLDSIEQLASRADVEWAEPSLVVTPEVDAVIPKDPLWPGLWDRQLIAIQDAFQHLQDNNLDTFGDQDIVLAIWDSGVQSVLGVPRNDDFNGTLSDGTAKVIATYDFENMVANNDAPWDDHGSGVAGVSTARANNPSPIPGQAYGVVGSAPNVHIMTVEGRVPYVDIEVADQYIWMAGFDPHSPLPGFPAAPPLRGADVITCSLTPGAGAPLSGTARATLDFVTTFGRGGKGTLCFFSTGNANQNNVTARPYGAYEKCFGIAATSYADDGVTEIRAPYSGWGQIALCAPSQDQIPTVHNPPTGYMPWGASHEGEGNLISYVQTQTSLAAASAAGATVLTVTNVAGLAANAVIHIGPIGAVGSEPARVTAVNAATNQLTVVGYDGGFGGGLLNPHAVGDAVATGPANHRNDFGGTSSATPLCAGVAALVLSANPALTFIEVRQIMRDSAAQFDLLNNDPVGRWLDRNGNPSTISGLPPIKSGWYGYGRVNAGVAVQTAIDYPLTRDLVVRDNLVDSGMVASAGAFWDSPDIWCRRTHPAFDPGAIPGSYATAGPHQDPARGHDNWVYARVRNNGTTESLDAWVRISVSHFPGMEFTYPASFEPTNGPGDPIIAPMPTGTYFIGEAKVTAIPPGGEQVVHVLWPSALVPPADVVTSSGTVHWHPCLLAEITPHDGPAPTGNHVWDDNNLAQKNITIVDVDTGADFAFATVIGNPDNPADYLVLEVNRGSLPREVALYVDVLDPLLMRRLNHAGLRETEEAVAEGEWGGSTALAVRRAPPTTYAPPSTKVATRLELETRRQGWHVGWHHGREVLLLQPQPRVQIPIRAGSGHLTTVVVGGTVARGARPGRYEVVLVQRQPSGQISGSALLSLAVGRRK